MLVALIWGTSFVVQRMATESIGPFQFNGLRFLVAAGFLWAWLLASKGRRQGAAPEAQAENRGRSLAYIMLAGSILTAAVAFQQIGIAETTAGNAGFITSLYVVLVPVILYAIWREKQRWYIWLAVGLAVLGSLLLSTGGVLHLARGDALELAGAVFWALHVIVVGRAVRVVNFLTLSAGMVLVAGLLNLALAVLFEESLVSGLVSSWWAVVYTGLFSIGLGFALQAYGQQHAPPADAVIILSTEAVFAALTGFLVLDEKLVPVQILGCALILGAILLAQAGSLRHR